MTVSSVEKLACFYRFRVPVARGWRARGGGYHVPVQPTSDTQGSGGSPDATVGSGMADLLVVELEPERKRYCFFGGG